jgi:hypothetical protein
MKQKAVIDSKMKTNYPIKKENSNNCLDYKKIDI